jgi:hypothetical protein
VQCSVQFENSKKIMPSDAKLEGSCCAPMDEARYRQQLDGLKKYSDIAEVPPDPYDIPAPLSDGSSAITTWRSITGSRLRTIMRCGTPTWRVHAAASAGAGRCMAD